MSPWEFIGWLIAIPLATFTVVFVLALIVTMYKLAVKRIRAARSKRQFQADHPAYGRSHLRVVPDRY
jgi:hypothetical protein